MTQKEYEKYLVAFTESPKAAIKAGRIEYIRDEGLRILRPEECIENDKMSDKLFDDFSQWCRKHTLEIIASFDPHPSMSDLSADDAITAFCFFRLPKIINDGRKTAQVDKIGGMLRYYKQSDSPLYETAKDCLHSVALGFPVNDVFRSFEKVKRQKGIIDREE